MDDGITAAGEGQVSEAHHLFARERTVTEVRLRERAEEVGARRAASRIELGVQVVLQLDAFLEAAPDAEDVDTPANPEVGFAFVRIEEIGERAGLEGQGESVHDLDRVASQRVA